MVFNFNYLFFPFGFFFASFEAFADAKHAQGAKN